VNEWEIAARLIGAVASVIGGVLTIVKAIQLRREAKTNCDEQEARIVSLERLVGLQGAALRTYEAEQWSWRQH
jgi:hypothetical protein